MATIIVSSGQLGTVPAGTGDTGDLVLSGGVLDVNGSIDLTNVQSGGIVNVEPGGIAFDTTLAGFDAVFGTDSATTIVGGGEMDVANHGNASGTIVDQGSLVVSSGGTTVSAVLDGSNAHEIVKGTASGTIVVVGDMTVSSGGIALNTSVNSGGAVTVSSGGTAINTDVSSNAIIGC